jgi:hypothetical protein
MSEYISILALLISLSSLFVSLYATFRDRVKLKAETIYYATDGNIPARVFIKIVNAGRRTALLATLIALTDGHEWLSSYFTNDHEALVLSEGESHEVEWQKGHLRMGPTGFNWLFIDLSIEDSLGHRYPVRHARRDLKRLLNS